MRLAETPEILSHVWLCIPSKRSGGECNPTLQKWRDMGYRIALHCDSEAEAEDKIADAVIVAPYQGYARAVNALVKSVLLFDPECKWVVTGGDDTEPDITKRPEEIAAECSEYFEDPGRNKYKWVSATFGVMQPTGDRFAGGCIDRICGSPWMGREFCELINGGQGPLWPEYVHMFVDEELQNIAQRLGILWQRRDLTHLHCHFQRESRDVNSNAIPKPRPSFLDDANSRPHWDKYEKLFRERKTSDFPGHELLAA